MKPAPILIAGQWRDAEAPVGNFSACDPRTGAQLPERYPISGATDVSAAFEAATRAVSELRSTPSETIAEFLERYALAIEARSETLVDVAARETALPAEPRLRSVELPRTVGQLRQGAAAARDRSWRHATIDTRANLRSQHAALGGAVLVFGPNNFPFAFNAVAGGDFVAAIAAGNPVIAKSNPGHPGTSRVLAECALEALRASGAPLSLVQLLYQVPNELGLAAVAEPRLSATAFTGSRAAGLRLKQAADAAGKLIYLEMSSVNPVFFLPGALAERGASLAKELFESCAAGAGQFCTRPGLSFVVGDAPGQGFVDELRTAFTGGTPGTLLGPAVRDALTANVAALVRDGARVLAGGHALADSRFAFEPTLLEVSGSAFLDKPLALGRESFGTLHLVVRASDVRELSMLARSLEGNLTASLYSALDGRDEALYAELEPIVRAKVGRLLNDKMPTGVAVSPAMNHGGPYPATSHPGFTAVGIPASLLRFSALHSYDNVRPSRLPPELRDENPTGKMWRFIDGNWSQGHVATKAH